jgi:hypothetical protein
MLQVGRDLDLLQEPVGPDHGCQLRQQYLQRHVAVVLQIAGQIHRGHAALAKLPLDHVAVGQSRLQLLGYLRHRFSASIVSRRYWPVSHHWRLVPAGALTASSSSITWTI